MRQIPKADVERTLLQDARNHLVNAYSCLSDAAFNANSIQRTRHLNSLCEMIGSIEKGVLAILDAARAEAHEEDEG